jgi:2'-hydroxyisoflavone reductase
MWRQVMPGAPFSAEPVSGYDSGMRRALLLGGTCFFGKSIARTLVDRGYELTIFTRGQASRDDLPPHRHVRGDRKRREDVLAVGKSTSWDLVIDNIAFDESDMRIALDAFAGVGRYVFCSTVSVYRYTRERFPHPLKESFVDYEYRPVDEVPGDVHWGYARKKMEAERVLVREGRMPWTIVRPPVVYGPEDPTDRGFWYLARVRDGGPLLLADGGRQTFRIIDAEDCARAHVDAGECPQAVGEAYNIAQWETITLREFVEESCRTLGSKPEFLSVPGELLGEAAGPWASMAPFIPDFSKAIAAWGFRPTPWPVLAERAARWFLEHEAQVTPRVLKGRDGELRFAKRWRALVAQFDKR